MDPTESITNISMGTKITMARIPFCPTSLFILCKFRTQRAAAASRARHNWTHVCFAKGQGRLRGSFSRGVILSQTRPSPSLLLITTFGVSPKNIRTQPTTRLHRTTRSTSIDITTEQIRWTCELQDLQSNFNDSLITIRFSIFTII